MKLIEKWQSRSIIESQKIAKELSSIFNSGDIVVLEGSLGSGKTFFVQNICSNWNIRDDVTSPTFTIIQNYNGDKLVNHMDLYRIENISELDQLGWEEMIYSDAISFIEWPEKIQPFIKRFYKVKISLIKEIRHIELYKYDISN